MRGSGRSAPRSLTSAFQRGVQDRRPAVHFDDAIDLRRKRRDVRVDEWLTERVQPGVRGGNFLAQLCDVGWKFSSLDPWL